MTRLMSAWAGVDRAPDPDDEEPRTSRAVESPKRLAACICSAVIPAPGSGGGDVGDRPPSPLRRPLRPPLLRESAWLSILATVAAGGGSATGGGAADADDGIGAGGITAGAYATL